MKKAINLCECMQKLTIANRILPYIKDHYYLEEGFEAEEGQLCIVNEIAEDFGYYDDYTWVSDIVSYKELYPINYCPICGKQIEYTRYNSLTKKL